MCILNPGTGGPYLDLGEAGYLSSTSLLDLINSAGWTHPEDGERLERKIRDLTAERDALQAEVSGLKVDAEKIAAAEALFRNASENASLASVFAATNGD